MKDRKPLAVAVFVVVFFGIGVYLGISKVHAADKRPTLTPQNQVDLLQLQVDYQKALPAAQQASQAAFQAVMKPIDDKYNVLTKGWCESKDKEQYKVFIPPNGQGNPNCYTQAEIDNIGKTPPKK